MRRMFRAFYHYYYLFYSKVLVQPDPHFETILALSAMQALWINAILDTFSVVVFCHKIGKWPMIGVLAIILFVNFKQHKWFRPLLIGQFTFQGSKVVRFVFTFDMQGTTDGDSLDRVLFEMRGATISLFGFFAPSRGSKPCKGLPSGSSLPVC